MTPGSKLGPYEILSKLGAGGMGEVYRARDTKLNREVAVKVIPPALSQDPARLARFEREAQVLAALNHPNIAAIHGMEGNALIMEFVPGENLSGPLALDIALPIARQLAEALEYAHEKGIVHRDLKPANIKVTPEGQVKVLDFGLAKAMSEEPTDHDYAHSPTLSLAATKMGVILGTAGYMSPEQAKGANVDKRADIWAYGAVLFEMLTGRRLINEPTASEALAAVLKSDLNFTALPESTPLRIRRLIERCLQRDPKQRLRDIGEARIAIDATDREPTTATPAAPRAAARPWLWITATALLAVALGAMLVLRPAAPAPEVARFTLALPVPVDMPVSLFGQLALSRDGRRFAYRGVKDGTAGIYLRSLDNSEVKLLPGTEGAAAPFFSPDGSWVAFISGGKLKKTPVLGGSPMAICDVPGNAFGGTWLSDGTIVFSRGFTMGLGRVPAAGGTPQLFMTPDPAKGESSYLWPHFLPGLNEVLFVVNPDNIASFNDAQIVIETVGKKESRQVLASGTFPHYTTTGHLVYGNDGSLLAAPFDLRHRKTTSPGVPVVEGVSMDSGDGGIQAAISESGTLIYVPGHMYEEKSRFVVVDTAGKAEPVGEFQSSVMGELSLSANGRKVAVRIIKANDDVHIYDLDRGSLARFTFEGGDEQAPVWAPDGKRVVYSAQRGSTPTLFWKTFEGNAAPEKITDAQHRQYASSFSPDGKFLAYTEYHPQTGGDIWVVRLDVSPRRPEPFLRTPFQEGMPVFSPDGRWIAYQSNESGKTQIHVAQFPGGGIKQQVSIEGGTQPTWAPGGKQLFFLNGSRLMAVDVNTQSGWSVGKPRMLFEHKFTVPSLEARRAYDVFPDGKRFLFVERAAQREVRELSVVLNWFEELKRKVK